MVDKYRDPIHGFIEVSELENEIINSAPFQRLRNIKQLAMTYLVFHGAEHTRFGHSIGVMHLASKAFDSAVKNGNYPFANEKFEWYKQILRLIALTHDLGHAPFSHAAEAVFPHGFEHEEFTEKIIKETCIASIIGRIGAEFTKKYGEGHEITADLICDIYMGRQPGAKSEYTFLKSFMDSELDCDKMDYLLRDSLFCGVNYGKYDIDRLLSSLTIYVQEGTPRLAINDGGIQAFEAFVLARYFMFVQVYFHRTRRYFDMMYEKALKKILPKGVFPCDIKEYLKWDDCRVLQLMNEQCENTEECNNIIKRIVYPRIFHTKAHPEGADKTVFKLVVRELKEKIPDARFLEDHSAEKMPHKIPRRTEVNDEKAIVIVDKDTDRCSTISEESHIIQSLTDKIDILRLYIEPEYGEEAKKITREIMKAIKD